MTREGNELTQVTVKTEINDYQQEIVTEYGLQIFYQKKNKSVRFSNALIFYILVYYFTKKWYNYNT